MLCYARSGGTVLNRCIACLPNVVMMSEVNPMGGGSGADRKNPCRTVQSQAKHWYGIDLKSDDFIESVVELHDICQSQGKHLVLRDWSFVNFAPCPENRGCPPGRFLMLESLKNKCELITFAFVRNAIDVCISRGQPVADFAAYYLAYSTAVIESSAAIFKYEDFCQDPTTTLRAMCKYTDLPYSDSFREYGKFRNVNGDVQGISRGNRDRAIRPLPRKWIPPGEVAEIEKCDDLIQANHLFGYSSLYNTGELEWIWKARARQAIGCMKRLAQKLEKRGDRSSMIGE